MKRRTALLDFGQKSNRAVLSFWVFFYFKLLFFKQINDFLNIHI
ncbi:MAG: hypothetical protein RIS64_3538 [Bacteroidota bacterium]